MFKLLLVATLLALASGQTANANNATCLGSVGNIYSGTYGNGGGRVTFVFSTQSGVTETSLSNTYFNIWNLNVNGAGDIYVREAGDLQNNPRCLFDNPGLYSLSISADCRTFTMTVVEDSCFARSQLYNGLSMSLSTYPRVQCQFNTGDTYKGTDPYFFDFYSTVHATFDNNTATFVQSSNVYFFQWTTQAGNVNVLDISAVSTGGTPTLESICSNEGVYAYSFSNNCQTFTLTVADDQCSTRKDLLNGIQMTLGAGAQLGVSGLLLAIVVLVAVFF